MMSGKTRKIPATNAKSHSREISTLALLPLLAFFGCISQKPSPPIARQTQKTLAACQLGSAFAERVENTLGEERARTQSSYSLWIVNTKDGRILCEDAVSPDLNVYPASTIKTLIAVAVLRLVDEGKLSLSDSVTIDQSNADAECKAWGCSKYGKGKKQTVEKLLFDMITVSNNIATNQLTDVATKPYINDVARLLEAPSLEIVRKMYDSVNPEPGITDRNHATSRGLAAVYREIASGRLGVLSEPSRAHLVSVLGQQTINGSLNRDFPSDVKFFHKTGNTSEVTGDGGFYFIDDETVAVVVGLQAFREFKLCDSCKKITGFQSLGSVGLQTLELTRSLDH